MKIIPFKDLSAAQNDFVTTPIYEFHINWFSRIKYKVDGALFESTGNVIFPDYRAVRELAFAINKQRSDENQELPPVRTGQLNAVGLLDEINHFLLRLYSDEVNPGVVQKAFRFLENSLTAIEFEKTLKEFLNEFPPISVYQQQQSIEQYFSGSTSGRLHKEIALEEMMMLFLANSNPASLPFKELFDDKTIRTNTKYPELFEALDRFFEAEKPFGPDSQPLLRALQAPYLLHPDNLAAQLGYFKERWGIILTAKFKEKITGSVELSLEEEKFIWHSFNPAGGAPSVETFVPVYKKENLTDEEQKELLLRGMSKPEDFIYAEPQQFTPDIDWMPNVVIIAKNIYVWLDQLSKKYQRPINRLDEIPDEELDQLARWSYTGLWLIGVWERSSASKHIKQIMGNSDAVSSAYSLYDYEIAWNLGGEEGFQNLNRRAMERGIRLAGDMVPNHMGIYSKWIVDHPEYFIQSDKSPYPNYTFTGENLSEHSEIELRIEDGYWRRSDAAVVFQRIDKRNGEVRYVYHGNDGTNMPWNDTAQLNLLRADVREAIIQNILHVARKFSIIRFDAAMTLAKKHYQRLWFPMMGTSGVPSRQDHALTRTEFDRMFPNEFWREVVDRFKTEMPQTLLLAEAFWLMEGYFVRTLGMHRVYNSAFMHMLMKEENDKYRALIKNTLEFNPEILKRYVNFMSNPDEETAIEQFGKGDKYFGVAMMMVTLPGLPMFAHGQIEGFKEKYGMEYQRAYYNETADHWHVRRHEEEIFPLTKKRYLFSQVHDFEFYDFLDERGFVNENVFAYSNRAGNERTMIFFHNAYAECKGNIKFSLLKAEYEGGSARSKSLADALSIQNHDKFFYRFRESRTKLEYLISGKQFHEEGWRIELQAYRYALFSEFVEMFDATGELAIVSDRTQGKGVENIDSLMQEIRLQPLHSILRDRVLSGSLEKKEKVHAGIFDAVTLALDLFGVERGNGPSLQVLIDFTSSVDIFLTQNKKNKQVRYFSDSKDLPPVLFLYHFIVCSRSILNGSNKIPNLPGIIVELRLESLIKDLSSQWNLHLNKNPMSIELIAILLRHHDRIITKTIDDSEIIERLMNDFETADFLGVNQHNDIWYYNKEQFEIVIPWIKTLQFIYTHQGSVSANPIEGDIASLHKSLDNIFERSERSGFQVEKLKEFGLSTEKQRSPEVRKSTSVKKRMQRVVKKITPKKDVKQVTKRKSKH